MILTLSGTEIIHVFKQPFGVLMHSVLKRGGAPGSMDGAFGRGTVIAGEINDKGFTPLASRCVDYAPNVMVGMGEETGEAFHQSSCHRPVALWVLCPRGDLFGSWCERCVCRNYPQAELLRIDLITKIVPSVVKLSPELIDPFARSVMWGVHSRSGEVAEPRAMGC